MVCDPSAKQDNGVVDVRHFRGSCTLSSTGEESDAIPARGPSCGCVPRKRDGNRRTPRSKGRRRSVSSIHSCVDFAIKQVSRRRSCGSLNESQARRSSDLSDSRRVNSFRHRLYSQSVEFGPLDTACNLEYPMWVVPIQTVLTMQTVEPHQVLKGRGDLVMHHSRDNSGCAVIFVSHQWISVRHPDPEGKQLKVLQEALTRLLSGYEVRSTAMSSVLFKKEDVERNWSKILAKGRIWYDYFSIPQTTYDPGCSHDLTRAVRSIPAYVEMSNYAFVLAPPVPHKEFQEPQTGLPIMCDYFSWLERGWCLLEKMAQFLKVNSSPVVVIRSGRQMEFQDHLDTIARRLGDAHFSCCSLNHTVTVSDDTAPDGLKKLALRCDKMKVRQLLECLIARRLEYELQDPKGCIDSYRLLRALRTYFLSNLPCAEESCMDVQERSVENWLNEYRFTEDIVSKKNRSLRGYTPLRFAAISGNSFIVRKFLDMRAEVNAPFEKHDQRWGVFRGCNILCHTAMFCNGPDWQDCMTLLLNAKADVQSGGLDVLNSACLASKPRKLVLAMNPVERPETWRHWGAEWALEHVVRPRLLDVNATSLAFNRAHCVLTSCARSGNINMMELLASHGADFTMRFPVHQADALFCACSTCPTSSIDMAEYCHDRLIVAGLKVDINRRLWLPRMLYWSVFAMVKCGNRSSWLRSILFWHGATALLTATLEGKCRVVQWLLEKQADPCIPNAAGDTALKVATRCGFINVVNVLQEFQPLQR